jgi:hypothetical protein
MEAAQILAGRDELTLHRLTPELLLVEYGPTPEQRHLLFGVPQVSHQNGPGAGEYAELG